MPHDLVVLAIVFAPLAAFSALLLTIFELYDSDPPSEVLKRWWARRKLRAPLAAIWWWV